MDNGQTLTVGIISILCHILQTRCRDGSPKFGIPNRDRLETQVIKTEPIYLEALRAFFSPAV
jgi:hypothetical protein